MPTGFMLGELDAGDRPYSEVIAVKGARYPHGYREWKSGIR